MTTVELGRRLKELQQELAGLHLRDHQFFVGPSERRRLKARRAAHQRTRRAARRSA